MTPMEFTRLCLPVFLLVACHAESDAPEPEASTATSSPTVDIPMPAPGEPGGLPDDRTALGEGPIDETSAKGAGQVLQRYFSLVEAKRYGDAFRLWSGEGTGSGLSAPAFADSFAGYSEYHAEIGAPGPIEGAAGSLYVEVPVRVYGRTKAGEGFSSRGVATLRRANEVPGSAPQQRRWHLYNLGVDTPA